MSEQVIWKSGEDGYHTYRIPALITTPGGTVLAFCEGRKAGRGDSGNIDLLMKRSTDNGRTWSDSVVVWDDGDNTCGNPCPVIDASTGRIHLLLTWNRGEDDGRELHEGTGEDTRRVFYCWSDDEGSSWTDPVEITQSVKPDGWAWYATGPGVGIQLTRGPHKGRLVVPCDYTTLEGPVHGSHAIYSDDGGKTWQLSETISPTCNECQVAELSDGRLLMSIRTQGARNTPRPYTGYRSIAYSNDGGATWTDPVADDELGDPVCQASLIRYDDRRLLFANPSPPISPKSGPRNRMTVRVSDDDGQSWPESRLIHEGPAAYSCLTRLPDDRVGLLYEAGKKNAYETITLATFALDWIAGGDKP
ncbi:sialidase family protein [Maioricimonas sp. JC845]|uniref:sialidase family protein n=1 Tax=Maioricimonas sp. JC845 TaxID=3232138 RepID=UPI00345AC3AD